MISCEKAAILMDRKDFEKLSRKDKFNLFVHNVYCKVCRGYHQLSKRFRALIDKEKMTPPSLSISEKNQLKKSLLKD